jgi:hypothetical protein
MLNFNLSFHGRTREMCRWVIANYCNNKDYKDNLSVQQWVKDCRTWLDAKAQDELFEEALEIKFGKIE